MTEGGGRGVGGRLRMTWLLVPLRCLGLCILLLLGHLLIYIGGRPLEMVKTATDTSLEILKRHYMDIN